MATAHDLCRRQNCKTVSDGESTRRGVGVSEAELKLRAIASHPLDASASKDHGCFDMSDICFAALGDSDRLRVCVRPHPTAAAPAFTVVAERRSSKQQWKLDVVNLAQYCDTTVPDRVLLSHLKVGGCVLFYCYCLRWLSACRKRLCVV